MRDAGLLHLSTVPLWCITLPEPFLHPGCMQRLHKAIFEPHVHTWWLVGPNCAVPVMPTDTDLRTEAEALLQWILLGPRRDRPSELGGDFVERRKKRPEGWRLLNPKH